MKTRNYKLNDPDDLREKVEQYFMDCDASKKEYQLKNGDIKIRQIYPTLSGLALYLGVTPGLINDYIDGNLDNMPEDIAIQMRSILADAKTRIVRDLEQASLTGDAESRTVAAALARLQGPVENSVHVVIEHDAGEDYAV